MTGDALAEMEHKHVLDTICRINGKQPALARVRGLRREEERRKEVGKVSQSHCSTGVFKHHHRV